MQIAAPVAQPVTSVQPPFDLYCRSAKPRTNFFPQYSPAISIPADGVIVGDPRARLEFPPGAVLDATVDVQGFVVDGYADAGTSIPASSLFRHLPAAVLKANVVNAARTVRKKAIA